MVINNDNIILFNPIFIFSLTFESFYLIHPRILSDCKHIFFWVFTVPRLDSGILGCFDCMGLFASLWMHEKMKEVSKNDLWYFSTKLKLLRYVTFIQSSRMKKYMRFSHYHMILSFQPNQFQFREKSIFREIAIFRHVNAVISKLIILWLVAMEIPSPFVGCWLAYERRGLLKDPQPAADQEKIQLSSSPIRNSRFTRNSQFFLLLTISSIDYFFGEQSTLRKLKLNSIVIIFMLSTHKKSIRSISYEPTR